jgi:xylose isomerase
MDATARALLNAAAIIEDGALQRQVDERYAGWDGELGRAILAGERSLEDLAALVEERSLDPQPRSGRQEYLESLVNRFS